MDRPIRSFEQDAEGDWVARLSCGHPQHTRHNPPFAERAWVLDEAGRASRVGSLLDCFLCDRAELPSDCQLYQRTKTFDEETVPAGLRANHSTKAGVWGLIHVESGELEYRIEGSPEATRLLRPGEAPGTVVPEVLHRVDPQGRVRFYVEFWRRGEKGPAAKRR